MSEQPSEPIPLADFLRCCGDWLTPGAVWTDSEGNVEVVPVPSKRTKPHGLLVREQSGEAEVKPNLKVTA